MIPVLHGVWAAAGGLVGDFEHIETQTVGAGGAASITFSSIPGTYKHLQIRCIVRYTSNAINNPMYLSFNNDSGTNYAMHYLLGDGASAASGNVINTTKIDIDRVAATGSTANTFGASITDILDYANTSKNKTTRNLGGMDNNGSGYIFFESGLWRSTSAITSLKLVPVENSFVQYSTFSLYGVK